MVRLPIATLHFLQENKSNMVHQPGVPRVKKYSIFFAFSLLALSQFAVAARVSTVKNNKIMIELEGDSASPGSEFFVINAQGKKVAIVKVTQVKGGRAIAEITKGTAKEGYTLQSRGGGSGSMSTKPSSSSSSGDDSYYDRKLSQRSHNGNSWGVLGGYLMNSMTVATTNMKINMSGSGFGALGYYDYALSPSIVVRAMGGLETYNVTGSNTASSPSNCLTDCNVKLTYTSLYGYGRWNFMQGKFKSWLGGGVGYLIPMSASSTVFNKNELGTNQTFMFAVGTDVQLDNKTYMPISLEYGLYPTTSTVKASIILLRLGYAWNL